MERNDVQVKDTVSQVKEKASDVMETIEDKVKSAAEDIGTLCPRVVTYISQLVQEVYGMRRFGGAQGR